MGVTSLTTACRARPFFQGSTVCLRCSIRAAAHNSPASIQRWLSNRASFESSKLSPKGSLNFVRPKSLRRPPKHNIRHQLRVWAAQQHDNPLLPDLTANDDGNNLARPEDIITRQSDQATLEFDLDSSDPLDASANDHDLGGLYETSIPDLDTLEDMAKANPADKAIISPGDLVELPPVSLDPQLVVFLGFSHNMEALFLDAYGKAYRYRQFKPLFRLPALVPPNELDPISSRIPSDETRTVFADAIPRHLAYPVIWRIRRFKDKVHRVQSSLEPSLTEAHRLVAHPTRPRYLPLQTIVESVVNYMNCPLDPTAPDVVFAVSSALLRRDFGFAMMHREHFALNNPVVVYSLQLADSVRKVETSVRAYHERAALFAGGFDVPAPITKLANCVDRFANNYQLIARGNPSGTHKTTHGSLLATSNPPYEATTSPTRDQTRSYEFSDNDRDFIRVLRLTSLDREFKEHPLLRTTPSNLLRILGALESPHGMPNVRLSARNALIAIGAVSPYSLHVTYDDGLWPLSNEMMKQLDSVASSVEQGTPPESLAEFSDSMRGFRKDWGDLPVYTIDAPDTLDLDDGISIEPVPDSPGHVWIHCHFAHLSAFASHDSLVGKAAAHNCRTKFFQTLRHPMAPTWATNYCSVGANKPVLTVSAKLNAQGDILASDIKPGIVRNFVKMTTKDVDRALESRPPSQEFPMNHFSVGEKPKTSTKSSGFQTPNEEQTRNLRLMLQAVEPISNKLFLGFLTNKQSFSTGVGVENPSSVVESREVDPKTPEFHTDAPYISFVVEPRYGPPDVLTNAILDKTSKPSQRIIEHFMALAGVVAAEWCASRDIPLVYKASRPFAGGFDQAMEHARAESRSGRRPLGLMLALQKNFAFQYLTSSPEPHNWIRASQFAPITNPLRMYECLVNHWQIDAALKEEARTGKPLSETRDRSFLPFQVPDIDEICKLCKAQSASTAAVKALETRLWANQLLARSHYFNESPLPDPLLCMIEGHGQVGRLVQFTSACIIYNEDTSDLSLKPSEGEVWEVKIRSINPTGDFSVLPIRCARSTDGTWLGDYQGYRHQQFRTADERVGAPSIETAA